MAQWIAYLLNVRVAWVRVPRLTKATCNTPSRHKALGYCNGARYNSLHDLVPPRGIDNNNIHYSGHATYRRTICKWMEWLKTLLGL